MFSRHAAMKVAVGQQPATRVLKGGLLVNVHTAEIYPADIAIANDRIGAIGDVDYTIGPETEVVDVAGLYVVPGLVETHYHTYETQLSMTELARALLLRGTTTMPVSFYGHGIVRGVEAIKFLYDEFRRTPLRVYFMVPTLTYLQNRELGLDISPYTPSNDAFIDMLSWENCIGLEEPPLLPILEGDPVITELYERTLADGKVITGHAAGLRGRPLMAYVASGTASDHESVKTDEAIEKVRLGMAISVREGSGMTDLRTLVRALTHSRLDSRYFNFCNDVASPFRLAFEGHIDDCVRKAISQGVNPITAVQMATINAAQLLRLDQQIGSVAPGKLADLLVVGDLASLQIRQVIVGGESIIRDGVFLKEIVPPTYPGFMLDTMDVRVPLVEETFTVPSSRANGKSTVRVIFSPVGSILTPEQHFEVPVRNGQILPDLQQDVLKIAMIDRFGRPRVGVGFVKGFMLRQGAIATTYNPVHENVLIVGTNDRDMALAAEALVGFGGGMVAIADGRILEKCELPLLGLLSTMRYEEVVARMGALNRAVHELGCPYPEPFHTLAFLGVCGETGILKISPRGLFRVDLRETVSVEV